MEAPPRTCPSTSKEVGRMSNHTDTLVAVVSKTMAKGLNRGLTEGEQEMLRRGETIQVVCGGAPIGMSVIERVVRRDDRVFHLSAPPKKVIRMRILIPTDSTTPCIEKSRTLVARAYRLYARASRRSAKGTPPVDISVAFDRGTATPGFVFKLPP